MDRDWRPVIVPLGPRLRVMAERLLGARSVRPDWLAVSDALGARVAALVSPAAGARHERVEVDSRIPGDEAYTAGDDGLVDPTAPEEHETLPALVRERLRSRVGEAADAMRIHNDEPAHRIAEGHRADAVASGSDVYFGRGRYRPHDEAGFALLAHEATHVSQALRPNTGWRRPMLSEIEAEEAVATAVERNVRRPAAFPGPRRGAAAEPVRFAEHAVAAAPPAPPARPMTAAADRPLDTAAPTAPIDMERLRQTLARDLLRQIRSELERGG